MPPNATEALNITPLPTAFPVMTRVADRAPTPVGLNKTGIDVAPPLGARVMGFAALGAVYPAGKIKSAALLPAKVSPVMTTETVPGLLTLTDCDDVGVPTAVSAKVREGGFTLNPVVSTELPVSVTECGMPVSSLTTSLAERVVLALGANITFTTTDWPWDRENGVFTPVTRKSLALSPTSSRLKTCTVVVPLFAIVTGTGLLVVPTACVGKAIEDGVTENPGGVLTPVPDSVTGCELPPVLSETVIVAVRDPIADGVNLTGMLTEVPAFTVMGAIDVVEKSLKFVPDSAKPVICAELPPEFVTVMLSAELVVPTV